MAITPMSPFRSPYVVRAVLSAAICATALLFGKPADAAERTFGLGFILGQPSAISMKLRLADRNALQFHLGFNVAGKNNGRFVGIVDYLFTFAVTNAGDAGILAPYLGVGGKIGVAEGADSPAVGVRVPLGLSFLIRQVPLEIFAEIALGIYVIPSTTALVDGGLGLRFYF